MRKFWLLVAIIAFVSCNNESADYALISGKLDNVDTKEIIIYGTSDRSFKKVIAIADDGTFNDTIKATGEYFIYHAKKRIPIYVEKGNDITINYDIKDLKSTLSIAGIGAEVSNYLNAKSAKESEITGDGTGFYKYGEVDYKKTVYDIKTAHENLLAASTGISDTYKEIEKRNIYYGYLSYLINYKSYHSHYAQKPDFKPSKEFLVEFNDFDATNENDFKNIPAYKSLVTSYYRNKASEIADEDDQYASIAMLKVIAAIENQHIKNTLAFDASRFYITITDKVEEFYTAYKAIGSTNEENNAKIEKSYNVLVKLAKGKPSPKFVDYENYKGGTTSLDDLKGKYTYIDVWATWCGPCIREIPYLKKIEKQYHGKNIQFLSISVDVKKDYQKWRDMIKEKELGGIQLLADKANQSDFYKEYNIVGIPKFILLDPAGNIVTANAPRPSNKALVDLFKELKI